MSTNKTPAGHTKHRFGHLMITFGMFMWIALSVAVNWAPGSAQAVSIGSVLSLSNSQRTANGVAALTANSTLNAAAQAKAQHMLNNDYWAHNAPDGTTWFSFIVAQGYSYQTAGENLALTSSPGGSASDVVTGWMNSPGHRANLLNSAFTEVGHGVVFAPTGVGEHEFASYLVVAMYALPNTPTPPPPPPEPDPPAPDTNPEPEPEPETEPTTAPAPPTSTPIVEEPEEPEAEAEEPEQIAQSEPIPENQSVPADDEIPTTPVVPVASVNPTTDRLIAPELAILLATVAAGIIVAGIYLEVRWVKKHGHIQHIHFPHL